MRRAYKFRLFTDANQERELGTMLETRRRLYNSCLKERKTAYEADKTTIKYPAQSARFKAERAANPYRKISRKPTPFRGGMKAPSLC